MKKILFLYVALLSMSASVMADGLTATLQQGESMTPFYGVDAFKQAYEAAQDGAVITLSSGKFNDVSSIDKSITIVGAYAFDAKDPEATVLTATTINADNVKIEGIYFSSDVTIGGVSNCHLKRSWVNGYLTSTSGTEHVNTLIDQCLIKKDAAIANGKNYCIKNCTIGGFYAMNTTENIAYITNCYVYYWYCRDSPSMKQPYAIYKNNMLQLVNNTSSSPRLSLSSPSEFYYNVFVKCHAGGAYFTTDYIRFEFNSGCVNLGNDYSSSFQSCTIGLNDNSDNKTGQDGTPVGITGGTGFSKYPAIPRITNQAIDATTDAEGKLNVKVAVEVQK